MRVRINVVYFMRASLSLEFMQNIFQIYNNFSKTLHEFQMYFFWEKTLVEVVDVASTN